MGWFDGEPTWLIVLVSVFLLVGFMVIVGRLIKWSAWFLLVGVIACVVFGAGWFFLAAR